MRIIAGIDKTVSPGKRDFAILFLAMTTGIRAGDLIRLRLTDIKWAEGELHIIQQKTGRALVLPLLKPVSADFFNERPLREETFSISDDILAYISVAHKNYRIPVPILSSIRA